MLLASQKPCEIGRESVILQVRKKSSEVKGLAQGHTSLLNISYFKMV